MVKFFCRSPIDSPISLTPKIGVCVDPGLNLRNSPQSPHTRDEMFNKMLRHRIIWLIMGIEAIPQSLKGGWILAHHYDLFGAQTVL